MRERNEFLSAKLCTSMQKSFAEKEEKRQLDKFTSHSSSCVSFRNRIFIFHSNGWRSKKVLCWWKLYPRTIFGVSSSWTFDERLSCHHHHGQTMAIKPGNPRLSQAKCRNHLWSFLLKPSKQIGNYFRFETQKLLNTFLGLAPSDLFLLHVLTKQWIDFGYIKTQTVLSYSFEQAKYWILEPQRERPDKWFQDDRGNYFYYLRCSLNNAISFSADAFIERRSFLWLKERRRREFGGSNEHI